MRMGYLDRRAREYMLLSRLEILKLVGKLAGRAILEAAEDLLIRDASSVNTSQVR
jgi:hypothetical protein